jgi:hypothetical protein
MKTLIAIFICCFLTHTYSQVYPVISSPKIDYELFFLPQGLVINSLSGYGSSNSYNSAANIGSLNPAAIDNFERRSFGVSYHFESGKEEAYIAGIGRKRIANPLPQSAGFIYPLNDFRIAFSFSQYYNNQMLIGKIPITTFSQPDGTGEFIEPVMQLNVNDYSLTASYSKNFESSKFTAGVRYKIVRASNIEEIFQGKTENILWGNSFSAGAIYKFHTGEKYYWSAALSIDAGNKLTTEYLSKSGQVFRNNYSVMDQITTITLRVPSKILLDFELYNFSNVKFLTGLNYFLWNSVSSTYNNQADVSFSTVYSFNNYLSSSLGFYYSGNRYNEQNGFYKDGISNKMKALYLTAGLAWQIGLFDLHFVLADSHLASGEWRKQTIGKLIFNFNF